MEPIAEYKVDTVSATVAEVGDIVIDQDVAEDQSTFVIDENDRYRKVIKPTLIKENPKNPLASVKIEIKYQRRENGSSEWTDGPYFPCNKLCGAEEIRICLGSEATLELFEHLRRLYAISNEALVYGSNNFITINRNILEGNEQELVDLLLERNTEFINTINRLHPGFIKALAQQEMLEKRQATVSEFERQMMLKEWSEHDWAGFFGANKWIFGHGLDYQILTPIQEQPHYGGTRLDGSGAQRGDTLMRTEGEISFTVLVELKKPQTPLLKPSAYRASTYAVGDDVAGGVSQLQTNCAELVRRMTTDSEAIVDFARQDICTYEPKGILVVGDLTLIKSEQLKLASFQRFRRNLHNPEIITYDELLARGKFMVSHLDETIMTDAVAQESTHSSMGAEEDEYDIWEDA